MYLTRVRRRVVAVVVTVAVAGLYAAAPVSADLNCDSGELCLWGNTGYSGDFWDPTHHDLNWPFLGIENDDDSVKNRDTRAHLVYPNSGGGGPLRYCVNSLENTANINDARDNDGDSNLQLDVTACPAGYPHP